MKDTCFIVLSEHGIERIATRFSYGGAGVLLLIATICGPDFLRAVM